MMPSQKVTKFVAEAIECSVFASPRSPGLTYQEILEIGARAGYREGELNDAIAAMGLPTTDERPFRYLPDMPTRMTWKVFLSETPEYRDLDAFDFIYAEFGELARNLGQSKAVADRDTLIARASAKGIAQSGVETAFAILIMAEYMVEKDGALRFSIPVYANGRSFSQQLKQTSHVVPRKTRAEVMPSVEDVVSRRTDGRPSHAEPLDAFADRLGSLGYAGFRLWWVQTVAEMRRADAQSSPLAVCVLAAAIVEGALTFVVKHARARQSGPFGSTTFERDPRTWRIDDLVSSAASGGADAILDATIKGRADALVRTRQRIHAGRMLSEFPAGMADLRPEEARDARQTSELLVRAVLDWLDRFPPA